MKKKLITFYTIMTLIMATMSTLTAVWWNNPGPQEVVNSRLLPWQLVYAKLCPTFLFFLYTIFNIWIQCSNRVISRQIIHPWISCRCSLYTFLFLLPALMTITESVGIVFYVDLLKTGCINTGYFYLMGIGLLPATLFQLSSLKWCVFVKKYVTLRERRVRNLLIRMEQQDQEAMLRRNNRRSAQIAI